MLQREGERLVAAHVAGSTATKYSSHVRYYARFLVAHGLGQHLLQPSQQVLIWYIAFLSRTCGYSTYQDVFARAAGLLATIPRPQPYGRLGEGALGTPGRATAETAARPA